MIVFVTDWADDQLALLRPNYPAWQLWVVRRYIGGTVWCAKPAGAPIATINTDTPEQLIEAIRDQEREKALGNHP